MRIAALVLAAGRSERFGPSNKLLADCGGEPMVRHVVRAACSCKASAVFLVTGTDHAAMSAAAGDLPIQIVTTGDGGLGVSIACAVGYLGPDFDGLLIVPGDMPGLHAGYLDAIIETFTQAKGQSIAIAVNVRGEQRNPVLWPRRCFGDLARLTGDRGAKALITSDAMPRLTVQPDDDGCLDDIDTPSDLVAFNRRTRMTAGVKNVLFLCTHNSCRSVIAESILNAEGHGRFRAHSAGSHPSGRINPGALDLLQRKEYPTEGLRSKTWDEFAATGAPAIDFIFTVCADAAGETCPIWPGHPTSAHWGVDDPSRFEGTDSERRAAFDETHRLLYERIKAFVELPFDALDSAALKQRLIAIGTIT